MEAEPAMRREKILKEIELPESLSAAIDNNTLVIKSSSNESKRTFNQKNVSIQIRDKKIILESKLGTKEGKKIIGSLTAHIKNMMKGSLQKHIYILKICSGHFPMNVSANSSKLTVKNFLGEKVPRMLNLKSGADVKIEGDMIYVTSNNKETAGQVSADIEQLTRRPGYDNRVFQDGIYITSKDGKELK